MREKPVLALALMFAIGIIGSGRAEKAGESNDSWPVVSREFIGDRSILS